MDTPDMEWMAFPAAAFLPPEPKAPKPAMSFARSAIDREDREEWLRRLVAQQRAAAVRDARLYPHARVVGYSLMSDRLRVRVKAGSRPI